MDDALKRTSGKRATPARKVFKRDNFFQRAEVIKRNREKRTRSGQFLVEGVAQISIAIKNNWGVAALLYASGRPLSRWATELVQSEIAEEQWELAPELMEELSEKDETSEVLAILYSKNLSLSDITPRYDGLIVVFDRPSSPGNLGSSLRSADAFGAHGVIVTGHAVDIYDPFVVRGSMGAIFAIPVITAPSHLEIAEWAHKARASGYDYQIIGSSGKTDKTLTAQSFQRPTILILGNETVGMSRGYFEICDAVVKIPIGGALSSLNVSCAASIILYEVSRQRAAAAEERDSK
jgi:TrmH family RNA methyltransferase